MLFIFDRFATRKHSRNWFKPNLTWSYLSFPYLTFPYAPKPFFLRQTSLNFYLHTFTSKSSISFFLFKCFKLFYTFQFSSTNGLFSLVFLTFIKHFRCVPWLYIFSASVHQIQIRLCNWVFPGKQLPPEDLQQRPIRIRTA